MPIYKQRNPAALSPYMRKGGVHSESPSRRRQKERLPSQDALDDCKEYLSELKGKEGPDGSSFLPLGIF